MEMEGSRKPGSDSVSASASGSASTLPSSQGSAAPLRSKECSRSSNVKVYESRSRESSPRRDRDRGYYSRSVRHRSRSRSRHRDRPRYGGGRRRRTPSLVLRSPGRYRRRRERRRSSSSERSRERRRSRSRSSSRRRRRERSRSRSSSRRRSRHAKSAKRGRSRSSSRSRSPPKKVHRGGNSSRSSSSSMETELRKHCKDIPDPSKASNENSSTEAEDNSKGKRFQSRVIFVTNLTPEITKEQLETLFGNFGKIREIDLYKITSLQSTYLEVSPNEANASAFIKFAKAGSTNVAVHLIGFPFLGRPLLVFPCAELDEIPDREKTRKLFALGIEKVIQLIKDEGLHQILDEKPEEPEVEGELKTSSEPEQPVHHMTSAEESFKDIQVLLSWPNDWLNFQNG